MKCFFIVSKIMLKLHEKIFEGIMNYRCFPLASKAFYPFCDLHVGSWRRKNVFLLGPVSRRRTLNVEEMF